MKRDAAFYNETQQLQGQIIQAMRQTRPEVIQELSAQPLPPLLQVRGGYAESPGWFMVQAAEFDPEPLTVANLRVRDIYASERIVAALLEMLAGERWLARVGEAYGLTPAGRDILDRLRARTAKLLDPPSLPQPRAELERLVELLGKLFSLCLSAGDPPGSWCLAHSRRRAPGPDAPILQQISQFMSDFNAYRDDAHMAAWQAEGVAAYVWEAFNFVHSGQAKNAAELDEKLFFRGYSAGEWAGALQELRERGWLDGAAGGDHTVTAAGYDVQASVEEATDNFFYAPWAKLAAGEAAELQERLASLSQRLTEIVSG